MRFVIGFVRIIIILVIVRLVLRWVASLRAASPRRSRTVPERTGGTLVRDPHCGTYVPEARALTAGGMFFCSASCRDAWMAAHGQGARMKTSR